MKTLFHYVRPFLKKTIVFLFLMGMSNYGFAQPNPRLTYVNPTPNLATVTITNFGDETVDLSNYWLCLRPGTYRQLEALNCDGSLNVRPSASVIVSYNVPVGVDSDGLSFYLPNTTSNGGFGVAANVIDFVQWGAAGNIRESLAVEQGLWAEGDFISGVGPYEYIGNGTENGLPFWRSNQVDGGEITGGPFTFCVDGSPDNVSGVSVSGSSGSNASWVITDDQGLILGLPPTVEALEGVDFDGAGPGVCLIWYIRYADGLEGLAPGNNALTDLSGTFDLSNSISVTRNAVEAGEISGGPFVFTVDGSPDNVSGITTSGGTGSNAGWVVTDDRGTILGLPPTIEALEGVDFDGAGVGTCLIWYIRYEDDLEGLEPGNNALTDLSGCFDLSNSIEVVRNEQVDGGEITGGPFTFCVDGSPDNVSGVSVSGSSGSNASWVITDDQGLILGLPPTVEALEGVDFDGAGPGVCLIWYIRYADGLEGLAPGNNALTDLSGTFDLSNSISVTRNAVEAGEISGGPFVFTVDGEPDNVSGITTSGGTGSNAGWVVTDDRGTILGLPPTIEALEGVDFDGAGVGTCLIWYIRYEDDLEGLEPGNNALTDLSGCFDLSNSIEVVREEPIELNAVVFPNPASRFAFVLLRGVRNSDLQIELFDMSGTPVNAQTLIRRNFARINVSTLQSGVYMLSIRDNLTGARTIEQLVVGSRFKF